MDPPPTPTQNWLSSMLVDHERLIRKVCWAYSGTAEDREDLFQEIAARLLMAAKGYDRSRKLSTWIYRVALNTAIDFHRKRSRRLQKEQGGLEADRQAARQPDPLMTDQLRELRELLEEQSDADRALLLLHLDGNSHAEVAEVLGMSESNVGTRLSRLKKALRERTLARSYLE